MGGAGREENVGFQGEGERESMWARGAPYDLVVDVLRRKLDVGVQ